MAADAGLWYNVAGARQFRHSKHFMHRLRDSNTSVVANRSKQFGQKYPSMASKVHSGCRHLMAWQCEQKYIACRSENRLQAQEQTQLDIVREIARTKLDRCETHRAPCEPFMGGVFVAALLALCCSAAVADFTENTNEMSWIYGISLPSVWWAVNPSTLRCPLLVAVTAATAATLHSFSAALSVVEQQSI